MNAAALLLFGLAALAAAAAIAWVGRAYIRHGGRDRARLAMGAGAAALGALGLYAVIGSPAAPGAPYAPRIAAIKARVEAGGPEAVTAQELLAVLNEAARKNPADAEPRIFAGLIQMQSNQLREAARSFESALRRDPANARAALELARISAAMNGPAHQNTQQLMARAALLDPANPVPWIYKGLAAAEEGRRDDAVDAWQGALARFAPEDPRRQMALQMLAEAQKTPREEARPPS